MQPKQLAIVGATGAVGREMLNLLEKGLFPHLNASNLRLRLFASPRSQGKTLLCLGKTWICEALHLGCFEGLSGVFFDASDEVSRQWVPEALAAGAWVVDNSSTFRLEEGVPLVVPEVNGVLWRSQLAHKNLPRRLLSGPNCVVVPLTLPLAILQKQWGLKKVIVSTYQSTSGAGALAQVGLEEQTQKVLQGKKLTQQDRVLFGGRPIAFNCIPQIGKTSAQGWTSEEEKIQAETRKILNQPDLSILATAVRVPTLRGHAQSVYVQCEKPVSLPVFQEQLEAFSGIQVMEFPTAVDQAVGGQDVWVGRLRVDPLDPFGLCFWLVADNLRKGAALNALQMMSLWEDA